MYERLIAFIVVLPFIASVACIAMAFDDENGLFAIASAIFFLAFVQFVRQVYGQR